MLKIIYTVGPGAALMHLAWLASYWVNRGPTIPTVISAVVDVCLLILTGGRLIEMLTDLVDERRSTRTKRTH